MKEMSRHEESKTIFSNKHSACYNISILTACGGNNLEGHWVCVEAHGGYPDTITINSDGSGSADGISMNWYAEGKALTLVLGWLGDYFYTYKVSGNTLF